MMMMKGETEQSERPREEEKKKKEGAIVTERVGPPEGARSPASRGRLWNETSGSEREEAF